MIVTIARKSKTARAAAQRPEGGAGSMALGVLGVDPGRVLLQRLRAPRQGLLDRLPPAGAEHIALPDPVKPLLQLVQVDLVLLQFRERVVAGHMLLPHLR